MEHRLALDRKSNVEIEAIDNISSQDKVSNENCQKCEASYFVRIVKKLPCQLFNLLWPSCTPV